MASNIKLGVSRVNVTKPLVLKLDSTAHVALTCCFLLQRQKWIMSKSLCTEHFSLGSDFGKSETQEGGTSA